MVWFWNNVCRPSLGKFAAIFRWKERTHPAAPDLLVNLEQAHREWLYANTYFNCVADHDLIDYAIFNLGATEKKYIYLLKQARAKGICAETSVLERVLPLKKFGDQLL